jgi:hypothetical protein
MAFWKPGNSQPPIKTPQKSSNDILNSSSASKNSAEKTILSKSVMGMKFMKKKEESIRIEQEEKIKFDKISNINWIADEMTPETEMDIDDSELTCIKDDADNFSALPGRRSFGGFNKAVEKHYQQMVDHKRFQISAQADDAKVVTDEEMLLRYENLVGLPRGPSQGLRQDAKANTKGQHNKFSGQGADSSSGKSGGGNHSKNKSLHLGSGAQHKGATMEEVVHFEDRIGSGSNNANNVKRKGETESGGGNFQKKKFKR